MKRLRDVTALLLLLLALYGAVRLWQLSRNSVGVDFYQFWAVGQLLDRSGPVDVYTDAGRARHGAQLLDEARRGDSEFLRLVAGQRRVLETYSTPFLYTLFRLGGGGDYERDLRRFRLFCLAVLMLGLVGLARSCGHGWPATAALVAAFTVWFEPAISDLQVGNVNALQLGGLALFVLLQHGRAWRGRDLAGGAVLGLATAFKPTTIFVVVLVLFSRAVNRRYRPLAEGAAGLVLGGVLAFGVSALSFRRAGAWADWLSSLRLLPDEIITVEMGNFGPARLLGDWSGLELSPVLMPLFSVLAALAIWLGRDRTGDAERSAIEDRVAVAFGCLVMLLSIRLVWMHYFLLAIPAVVLLLAPDRRASTARRALAVIALVVLCIQPVVAPGIVRGFVALAVLVCLATATLFGLLFRAVVRD